MHRLCVCVCLCSAQPLNQLRTFFWPQKQHRHPNRVCLVFFHLWGGSVCVCLSLPFLHTAVTSNPSNTSEMSWNADCEAGLPPPEPNYLQTSALDLPDAPEADWEWKSPQSGSNIWWKVSPKKHVSTYFWLFSLEGIYREFLYFFSWTVWLIIITITNMTSPFEEIISKLVLCFMLSFCRVLRVEMNPVRRASHRDDSIHSKCVKDICRLFSQHRRNFRAQNERGEQNSGKLEWSCRLQDERWRDTLHQHHIWV